MAEKLINYAGKHYGHLHILSQTRKDHFGNVRWNARCYSPEHSEEGNPFIVSSRQIRAGIVDCGCLKRKYKLAHPPTKKLAKRPDTIIHPVTDSFLRGKLK